MANKLAIPNESSREPETAGLGANRSICQPMYRILEESAGPAR